MLSFDEDTRLDGMPDHNIAFGMFDEPDFQPELGTRDHGIQWNSVAF